MEDRRQRREFRAIDETEISDFNVVLREQGFDRDDFELAEELDEPAREMDVAVGRSCSASPIIVVALKL